MWWCDARLGAAEKIRAFRSLSVHPPSAPSAPTLPVLNAPITARAPAHILRRVCICEVTITGSAQGEQSFVVPNMCILALVVVHPSCIYIVQAASSTNCIRLFIHSHSHWREALHLPCGKSVTLHLHQTNAPMHSSSSLSQVLQITFKKLGNRGQPDRL